MEGDPPKRSRLMAVSSSESTGRRDEEIEVGDCRQLPQRQRRFDGRILEYGPQPHVGFFAPTAGSQEPAHHIVEGIALGQRGGINVQPRSQLLRGPVQQQSWASIGGDHQ